MGLVPIADAVKTMNPAWPELRGYECKLKVFGNNQQLCVLCSVEESLPSSPGLSVSRGARTYLHN